MSKKNDNKKNVVVVGGGYAGHIIAKTLSTTLNPSKHNLILVTSRPYLVHVIAGLRMNVTSDDQLEDTAFITYDKLFEKGIGSLVVGTVVSIKESGRGRGGVLTLQDGETIDYDVLALATGTKWSGPIDFPDTDAEIRASIQDWRHRYTIASEIALIGGGAVGIETAGEIKEAFPNKKVTIVHGGDLLLNDAYPDKFRKDIERRARAQGIDIILGDYIDEIPGAGTVGVTTRSGKTLPDVDLVVPTFGGRPNTEVISTLDSGVLTSRGFVRVDPTLQVTGHPGVFAAGDIIDWNEQKQAGKTGGHAAVVAANIVSYLAGKSLSKKYKGSFEMILIPLGKSGGSGYFGVLWGILVGGWVAKTIKGKTLLVPMFRKSMGW